MLKRIMALLAVLFAAGLTAACGMSVEQGEESGVEEVNKGSQGTGGNAGENPGQGIVAGELEPSLTQKENGEFVYTVKNQTEKEVTLEFTSSQRYDYAVKNDKGETLYLYSSAAAFLQVLGTETMVQGEELSYTFEIPPGGYEGEGSTIEVWLTPKGGKKAPVSIDMK